MNFCGTRFNLDGIFAPADFETVRTDVERVGGEITIAADADVIVYRPSTITLAKLSHAKRSGKQVITDTVFMRELARSILEQLGIVSTAQDMMNAAGAEAVEKHAAVMLKHHNAASERAREALHAELDAARVAFDELDGELPNDEKDYDF